MIVARPIKNEPDLLTGNENSPLIITDLCDQIKNTLEAPEDGWTHDKLEAINYDNISPCGWEAYLGNKGNWIGSSEV